MSFDDARRVRERRARSRHLTNHRPSFNVRRPASSPRRSAGASMTTVLFADYDYPDIELERAMFSDAGLDMVTAQCKTEEQVILHGAGCRAILLQYAPVSERVLSALPEIAIISRIGAGYDTIDTEACRRRGVWLANSPDYGVGEVATHALALALASIRNVVAYHRDIGKGDWNFLSSGPL